MVRFLIHVAISLGSAILGLLLAALLLPGFHMEWGGIVVAVLVFTIAQAILAPFVFNVARKHASAVLGGVGLVSTFLSLLVASFFPGGIRLEGIVTWILATLIVWIVTALGAWIVPLIVFRKKRAAG